MIAMLSKVVQDYKSYLELVHLPSALDQMVAESLASPTNPAS